MKHIVRVLRQARLCPLRRPRLLHVSPDLHLGEIEASDNSGSKNWVVGLGCEGPGSCPLTRRLPTGRPAHVPPAASGAEW